MNFQILRWLLAHKDTLLQIVEVVKPWHKDLPLLAHWEIVDKVARLVIPVLTEDDIVAMLEFQYEDEVQAFAAGAEVQALGVDWMALVQLIIPILEAIVRAYRCKDE